MLDEETPFTSEAVTNANISLPRATVPVEDGKSVLEKMRGMTAIEAKRHRKNGISLKQAQLVALHLRIPKNAPKD